jgi:hypothetical protein
VTQSISPAEETANASPSAPPRRGAQREDVAFL